MATYEQLRGLFENPVLLTKVDAAISIAVHTINAENPATADHGARIVWANQAIKDIRAESVKALKIALAGAQVGNGSVTTDALLASTDSAIQTAVNAAIKVLAGIQT